MKKRHRPHRSALGIPTTLVSPALALLETARPRSFEAVRLSPEGVDEFDVLRVAGEPLGDTPERRCDLLVAYEVQCVGQALSTALFHFLGHGHKRTPSCALKPLRIGTTLG